MEVEVLYLRVAGGKSSRNIGGKGKWPFGGGAAAQKLTGQQRENIDSGGVKPELPEGVYASHGKF